MASGRKVQAEEALEWQRLVPCDSSTQGPVHSMVRWRLCCSRGQVAGDIVPIKPERCASYGSEDLLVWADPEACLAEFVQPALRRGPKAEKLVPVIDSSA